MRSFELSGTYLHYRNTKAVNKFNFNIYIFFNSSTLTSDICVPCVQLPRTFTVRSRRIMPNTTYKRYGIHKLTKRETTAGKINVCDQDNVRRRLGLRTKQSSRLTSTQLLFELYCWSLSRSLSQWRPLGTQKLRA